MNQKIALITGGTSGVGLSLVKSLVKESYHVYFIGTNLNRGQEIESDIKSTVPAAGINFINLDLSHPKVIQRFIEGFKKQHTHLDLLANIAGVLLPKRQESIDGIEKTFAVNYLSAFYLTNALVPLLEKSRQARIVNVGGNPSIVLKTRLNFDDLNSTEKYSGFKASTGAVHAKTVFTQDLSKKLSGSNIVVNSFHPGIVKSELSRNLPVFLRYANKMVSPFFASKSNTGIYVCLSNDISEVTGKLFVGKKPVPINFSKDYRDRLREESEKIINRIL